MKIDIRTKKEIARERKHEQICGEFLAIIHENPSAAPTRVMNVIAERHDMTSMGIREILKRKGII